MPAILIAFTPRGAEASGALTLPFTQPNIAVNSWFDHTYPLQSGDTDPTMTRYDGTTGWSYDGHNGIDFGLSSGSNLFFYGQSSGSWAVRFATGSGTWLNPVSGEFSSGWSIIVPGDYNWN